MLPRPNVSPGVSFPIVGRNRAAVWLVAGLALAGWCVPTIAQEPRAAAPVDPPAAVGIEAKEFVYRKTPQGELLIEVFRAVDATPDKPRPAIVFFFGGAWKNGKREQFREAAEYLAGRGMIAATADYRIASKHKTLPDAAVEDAQHAVRWLRTEAEKLGIDPLRIAAGGGSAGGHLAACTALLPEPPVSEKAAAAVTARATKSAGVPPSAPQAVSSRPNALVLFNPVLDLEGLPLSGKTAQGEPLVEALSPVRFVRDDLPPTILFFGSADKFLEGAERYQEKVQRRQGRCDLLVADGEDHAFFNRQPWKATTLRAADEFLGSLGWLAGPPTIAAPPGGFRPLTGSNVTAATQSQPSD
ncbi:MAG TPA: alpha/beta hydrolase [Pirellulales bacterium]